MEPGLAKAGHVFHHGGRLAPPGGAAADSKRSYSPTACQGPQCLLAPMISALGVVLPGFARPWLDAFARAPGIFALIVAALAFLLMRSENLQRRIRDDMHTLWMPQTGAGNHRRSRPMD